MIRSLSKTTTRSYTVLIIEGVSVDRELYCNYLLADPSCNYKILEADSASAAMVLCRHNLIDGILVDDALPDATGLDFMLALQNRFDDSYPPVVMVASESDSAVPTGVAVQQAVRAIKLGAENYLVKQTLTPEQLQLVMRSAIRANNNCEASENARFPKKLLRELRFQSQHQEEQFRIQQLNRALANQVAELQTLIDMEAELRSREEQLRLFIKYTPAEVAMFDRQMRYISASDRWLTSYKLDSQNIISRSHYEVFPDIPERWKEIHQRCLAGAIEACAEDPFPRADGSLDWVRWEIHPWRTNTDEIGGIIIFSEVITDRKQAQERLRESENRFRTMAQAVPSFLFEANTAGLNTWVSEKWCQFTGQTPEQVSGHGWIQTIHPEDLSTIWEQWTRSLQKGVPYELKQRLRRFDGQYVWFIIRALPVGDEQGKVCRWVGSATNVDDFIRAETALRESEATIRRQFAELESIYATAPVGLCFQDTDLRYVRVNDRLAEIDGVPAADHLGRTTREVLPELADTLEPLHRHVIETGEPILNREIHGSTQTQPGTERDWIVSYYPLKDAEGQVLGVNVTLQEITALKQASRDRLLLAQIVESSSDAIIGLTLERQIISWNGAAERIFGYARTEVLAQDVAIFVPDDRTNESVMLFEATRQGKMVNQFETTRQRKDGSLVNVAITMSPIKNAQLEIIGVSEIVRDITFQKRLEQEREQLLAQAQSARAEAEAANRSKDEFVAIVAHELRSPLNAISGWAKLLQTRQFDAATTKKALETIARNTQVQVQLVEDLLDISRMVRGKLQLTMASTNLVEVIEAAVETVHPTALGKGLQLKMYLHNLAPVLGDFNRLQQVVLNLLTNAIKFTPAGGQVQVVLDQCNSQARIQVSDTGIGIRPDFLPYIFQRFRQDQQNTAAKQGLGLGLAIVKHIVEMHGGTVTVESQGEGQGATFTLMLPLLQQDEAEQEEAPASPQPPDSTSLPLADVRVLLVDDEPDMLSLTTFILEQYGAVVQTATSAPSALEQLSQFQPNILLSDIAMPEQDGYELLRRMRSLHPEEQIPAIALTAYSSETRQEKSLRAGFQQHLTKPVEPEQLVAAILCAIGLRRS